MEYFVTGGTGFIGTHLVEQLLADGHDVTVLSRSRANAAHLPRDVTVVEGDVTEKASMREAMDGVDGVFHVAAWYFLGPGRENAELAYRVNVRGTHNVFELMDELSVPRGVYTSTAAITGDTGPTPVDESFRYHGRLPTAYQRTKWQAHHNVALPMMDRGLPLVVVMPGAVYGPGDKASGSVREIAVRYLRRELPVIPRETTMPFDHVEDTARAHIRAMEDGTTGESYFITSEPRTLPDLLHRAETITGIPGPRPVPSSVFVGLAAVLRVAERIVTPPPGMQAEMLEFLGRTRWNVDSSKAKRDLGLAHRPLEEGLGPYLEWELDQLDRPQADPVTEPA